jgi:hypothetical protein
MSDEIFEVVTGFSDVAELGQGFIDRVDGERILLALAKDVAEGEGVRFIVHLVDGTPAFAGAGRCVQVSDQGAQAGNERYETLLDSLAFDERSAPVYEYIVAVRQLAYSENTGAEVTGQSATLYEGEDSVVSSTEQVTVSADDPTGQRVTRETLPPVEAVHAGARSQTPSEPLPAALGGSPSDLPEDSPFPVLASVVPEPLPTGILTRPAIAAHWAPNAPRPPIRSLRPMRFQYPPGPLPVPSEPPRPVLDRSQWVTRAEAPSA